MWLPSSWWRLDILAILAGAVEVVECAAVAACVGVVEADLGLSMMGSERWARKSVKQIWSG